MLEYICQQLEQLEIVKQLPNADVQIHPQPVINRATDVLSAVFCYFDIRIRRESSRLGIMGLAFHQLC